MDDNTLTIILTVIFADDLLMQLGPGIDFEAELGPPVIRDSWKTDHQIVASTASPSSKATTGTTMSSSKRGVSHLYPRPSAKVTPSALLPTKLYPDLNDQSRSSSHSPSSSVVIGITANPNLDHKRSPSATSGSLDSWSDSDESDDDSTRLSPDVRRLTLGSIDSAATSMESPHM